MKIKIIAVGKIKEKYVQAGIDEFLKRVTPYASVSVLEVPSVSIKDENLICKVLKEEGEKILSVIKPTDYVITMEINGKSFSSEEFSLKIQQLTNNGIGQLIFVVGSSCGIGENVSQRANLKMSLSKMTFLHEFARLILIEQIYRAFKIMKGETYHK